MRSRAVAVLSGLFIVVSPVEGAAQLSCGQLDGTHGSPDLRCLDLIPAGDAVGVADGIVELRMPQGPFTVAVTPGGEHVWRLVSTLQLPPPETFGGRAYVAWATTPVLRPFIRLGTVTSGTTELGEVGLDKFMVLISAEADPDTKVREGPLVLRGTSPSMRMQADHMPFLLSQTVQPATAGHAAMPAISGMQEHPHTPTTDAPGRHGAHPDAGPPGEPGGEWPLPAMPDDIVMLPGMMPRLPKVSPYTPAPPAAEAPEPAAEDLSEPPAPAASEPPAADASDSPGSGDADITLIAAPVSRSLAGVPMVGWAYNAGTPGPTLRVRQGDRLRVLYVNRTELPSTVHWHGLRLENRFDGVPGLTQELVAPGASFEYELRFPDPGVFWYHPHHREDIAQDLGLYGNILVEPVTGDASNPVHREEPLMLDDILLTEQGDAVMPHGREAATHALMGRFGNVLLVNGRADWTTQVRRGAVVRFPLTNAANTRTFNVSFGVDSVKLVGGDVGPYLHERWITSVPIAPAERYTVEVHYDRPGRYPITNRVHAIDHILGGFIERVDTIGVVVVTDGPPAQADPGEDPAAVHETLHRHDVVAADIERFRPHFDRPVDRTLRLRLEADSLPFPLNRLMRLDSAYFHPVEWDGTMPDMNWILSSEDVRWVLEDAATGDVNEAIDWDVTVDDVVKLRIINERGSLHAMQHPIHLHGQRFLIIEQDGVAKRDLVWKDTVLVPVGSYVDLLVDFSNPGQWMLHCHIAEHLEAGMRMVVDVAPAA